MRRRVLTFFQVVMINVIAVDSIRNLPFAATYGFTLVFFYLAAGLLFFLPAALVAAEMGTGWPTTGGLYIWVREAFGKKVSLVILWLNWLYNLFWFPTIMALIAGAITYLFDPALATNKIYMACTVVALFWGITLINCFGMKLSSQFSSFAAIFGTLLPMLGIILLAVWWIVKKEPMQISFSWEHFLPSSFDYANGAYLTNVLFGLIGLEMSAVHAEEMRSPERDYPRSLFLSALIILATTILSSLAIAIVVPDKELSLVTGTLQAFATFADILKFSWILPLAALFIAFGGLGGAAAWIIGPSKGLMVASKDGSLPRILMKENRHGVPINVLILQAIIVTLLSTAFVLMPTVSGSFWLLSLMTAQLALVVYIFMFASALILHHKKPHVYRSFKIPGGRIGIWIIASIGILSCIFVIGLGFIPPSHTPIQNILAYELMLIGGMLLFAVLPFLFLLKRRAR
ncbi:MAG: amino acid permease [Chlamydiales bacterium]|nr:amino acid permease [Chlamydiales bacterium]